MITYNDWIIELEREERDHAEFRTRSEKIYKVYLSEPKDEERFNILWSNVQMIKSVVLAKSPKPDVRRRYLDADPVARQISEVTERAMSYSVDTYNFFRILNSAVDDELVAGLGQTRLRYNPIFKDIPTRIPVQTNLEINQDDVEIPHFITDEGKEVPREEIQKDESGFYVLSIEQEKIFEEVKIEHVPWNQFRWQPGRNWDDVQWAAIDHFLDPQELLDQFGDRALEIPLNYNSKGAKLKAGEGQGAYALIHEIFDKRKRQILIISPGMRDFISKKKDGMNLNDFYPFPEPIISTTSTSKMIPVPDYVYYQDQAKELDVITQRISKLTRQLKYRGFYDGSLKDLANIQNLKDGQFQPIDDFSNRFPDKDINSVIASMPLRDIVFVIEMLVKRRDEIKQIIYEVIGISDILRGQSNANETLGAQQIKKEVGGLRISSRKERIDRFIRDVFRLKSEVISEHFSSDTLTTMTGVEVTPDMKSIMENDLLREYKIDVETDSTIFTDASMEQKNRIELITAMASFVQQIVPGIQMGLLKPEMAKEFMLFAIRSFKGGRKIESMMEANDNSQLAAEPGLNPLGGEQAGDQVPGGDNDVIGLGEQ